MKKKLLSVIAVVAVAIFAGYNVYVSQHDVELSDLFLTNVEALANIENQIKDVNLIWLVSVKQVIVIIIYIVIDKLVINKRMKLKIKFHPCNNL